MLIARWQITANFGKANDCIAILKKWEIDVGERAGWHIASVRLLKGVLGASDLDIEFEVHFDSLSDFESAWSDIEKTPYHRDYMKQLEGLVAPGGSRWQVFTAIDLRPSE